MDQNEIKELYFEVNYKTKISKEFREFLKKDDQGMEGVEFMLHDETLNKRIPPKIRTEYEILRAKIMEDVIDAIYTKADEIVRSGIEFIIKNRPE